MFFWSRYPQSEHDLRVMARVESSSGGNKPEGEIIRIITHANNKIVGIFHQSGDFGFVTPDDKRIGQDIYIMKRHFGGAKTNQKVVAEITEWPVERRNAEGKIIEILGNVGDAYSLKNKFSYFLYAFIAG